MKFVPIPATEIALRKTSQHWLPFLPDIAKRSKEPIETIIDQIIHGHVGIGLIWDEDAKQAVALIGIQMKRQGEELVGELLWVTGNGMKRWRELLPIVEQYMKEHLHCDICRPLCRPGWSPLLKQHGYKTTHYVMERRL